MKQHALLNDISIVIPTHNNQDSIMRMYHELSSVVTREDYTYEIIFVNDGSTDATEDLLNSIYNEDKGHVRVINFDKHYGTAYALRAGFRLAHGDIVVTMDPSLQDNPIEISRFVEKINYGYDVVSGWKYHRADSLVSKLSSRVYNSALSLITGVYLHDHDSSFKAYRSEVARVLPLSNSLNNSIPSLAYAAGFRAIAEIPVHNRHHSQSNSLVALVASKINTLIQLPRIVLNKNRKIVRASQYVPHYTLKNILT